jgi:5'-AMP-activated protein kinase catalytic alpha subunit
MSPELIKKQDYCGFASDVWACGVLLYAMLNGCFPYNAKTDRELFMKICKGLYGFRQGVSDDAQRIIKKIFEPDPDKRPSCSELLSDKWVIGSYEVFHSAKKSMKEAANTKKERENV